MSVILATAGYDHKIRFWEAPSGINSWTLRYPESQVNCLDITPDKRFLAAAGNPQIRLFEIMDTTNANPVLVLDGHSSAVTDIGFQRDVRFLYSGSEDCTVKIWDLRSSTFSCSFDCKSPVNSVALHPTRAEIISGDQNGKVKVWDIGTSKCINELSPSSSSESPSDIGDGQQQQQQQQPQPHTKAAIQSVDISEDGRICMGANNHGHVFLWDPTNDSKHFVPLAKFQAHPTGSYLLKAKISPDCRQLVTCSSDRTAKIFDITLPNGYNPGLEGFDHGSYGSNGGGGGKGVSGVGDTSVFQPKLQQTLAQHTKWVWDAVFSADSSYLVTASSDDSAKLWNLRSGEVVRHYDVSSAVTCVALNDSSSH